MKRLFFNGGAVQQVDPHAYIIENIQREDEMMQKLKEKEKEYQQQIQPPKSKE